MAASYTVPNIGDAAIHHFQSTLRNQKPEDMLKGMTKKPLLARLMEKKKDFGSAGLSIEAGAVRRVPVQLTRSKDTAGFYLGFNGDDSITPKGRAESQNADYPVRSCIALQQITEDDLLGQGIRFGQGFSMEPRITADQRDVITSFFNLWMGEVNESVNLARNAMLLSDGSTDAKGFVGLSALISDDPTAGTLGGIARATTTRWQHIARTGVGGAQAKITASKTLQTLTEALDTDRRRAQRAGGNLDSIFAGGDYIDALKSELRATGQNFLQQFNTGKAGISVEGIKAGNVEIVYDPTFDENGWAKRMYAFDSSQLYLDCLRGKWNEMKRRPEPADQLIMLFSVTDYGALVCKDAICNIVHVIN